MLLNNQRITEEIKDGNWKIPRDKWELKHDIPNPMGWRKSSYKREVYSNTSLT